uniref:Uncharacterized protein n=1 Tax=Hucho hucho TaxID=62062 RepID=A0A4W5NMG4_9TELE
VTSILSVLTASISLSLWKDGGSWYLFSLWSSFFLLLSCHFLGSLLGARLACNPSLVRAKGRGLQPKGLRVKETADFRVFTKGAGTGELKVTIKGPSESTTQQPLFHKLYQRYIFF